MTSFEELSERILRQPEAGQWTQLRSNPKAMSDPAKLLGTSDFLWEDFIRVQDEALVPIFKPHLEGQQFCAPIETLPRRMWQALKENEDLKAKQERLNQFKDQEIFLIDLDHILTSGSDFCELSLRLTLLAENLITAAATLVYGQLVQTYGVPHTADGQAVAFAVFGLGKLGGVALGYASDIELMFLYGSAGRSGGGTSSGLDCTEFYELHARDTAGFFQTKRSGIFEVDLRLRPYGLDGPLACRVEQFAEYHGSCGRAHPLERLALTRMRWIGGDAGLGFQVERLRDQFLYEGPPNDRDSLWDVTARQRQQKRSSGRQNAKYGAGALLYLETMVQLLQVMHARHAPQLRTPRLREVMEGLRRAGVLSPDKYAEVVGAYDFLRRLINGLRMLRGSALDLFLPPAGSDEPNHLSRRMGYRQQVPLSPDEVLMDKFTWHTNIVRQSFRRRFGPSYPGEN